MNRKVLYIISLLLFSFSTSVSQENIVKLENSKYFELRYQHGFIYKHASAIDRLVKGNISAIDVNLGWQTKGNSLWQQLYRYPNAGIGIYYSMLNYPEVLGNAISCYGFINIPLLNYRNKYVLSYHTGIGAAYVTKVYDANAEVKNDAYSTHLNLYFDFSIDLAVRIYKQFSLVNALGITHYSNGAVKMPNLGLNTITYQVGLNYNPSYSCSNRIKNKIIKPKKRNELRIFYSPTIKAIPPKGKVTYFASSLSINYGFILNQKRTLGVGLDLFYDESLKRIYLDNGVDYRPNFRFKPGYHLSQDLKFGKLSFLLESGWYFKTRFTDEDTFYHRLGIKYQFIENLFILYALKTHWVTADYMELAIGYNIKW